VIRNRGISLNERLALETVIAATGCWEWQGLTRGSYGRITFQNIKLTTHVASWELVYGPVPEGLELDHLCENKICLNPDHLEAVTHAENIRRALEGNFQEVCKRGHKRIPENLYRGIDCKLCAQVRYQESKTR